MKVCLNGRMVPKEEAVISIEDRGFLYGDGLFESIRICSNRPFRWDRHLDRFWTGVQALRLPCPWPGESLRGFAEALLRENRTVDGVLRLALSRGPGRRGYSPRGATHPTLVLSVHPLPDSPSSEPTTWRLRTVGLRILRGDPLARHKTASRLLQVLARLEAEEEGADEALLLNHEGQVAESASGNVFWVERENILTPPLSCGALPGITREVIVELGDRLGWPVREDDIDRERLGSVDGMFLTLTTRGVVEVVELDGQSMPRSARVPRLHRAYLDLVRTECA
jgi:branched-chain amino acid aminotransferase